MIKDRPKTETRRLSSRIRHHWNEGPGPAIAPRLFQKEAQDGYPPGLTGNCKVYNSSQADVMTRICCPCLYRHHRIRRSWSGRSHTAFLSSELPASPDPGLCDRRASATTYIRRTGLTKDGGSTQGENSDRLAYVLTMYSMISLRFIRHTRSTPLHPASLCLLLHLRL